THREEGAVAERDLAVEARQQVQPQQREGVGDDDGGLEHHVARQHEGQHASGDEQGGGKDASCHRQTLTTTALPNSPDGRATSTTMISTSATESLSSAP